mmetsp:Transcript_11119/g.29190  ORF Transcript_11119/g.29190 Transcript_11119/m.29190 type:complete len:218 (-) Transcript_11119:592-1245(-)
MAQKGPALFHLQRLSEHGGRRPLVTPDRPVILRPLPHVADHICEPKRIGIAQKGAGRTCTLTPVQCRVGVGKIACPDVCPVRCLRRLLVTPRVVTKGALPLSTSCHPLKLCFRRQPASNILAVRLRITHRHVHGRVRQPAAPLPFLSPSAHHCSGAGGDRGRSGHAAVIAAERAEDGRVEAFWREPRCPSHCLPPLQPTHCEGGVLHEGGKEVVGYR